MTTPDPESPHAWLLRLAPHSAATWQAAGARAFRGEVSVETTNAVYRFKHGIFLGRVRPPARTFDVPRDMRGLRLLGFLVDEGGLWSLSSRWSEGSRAVLWMPPCTGAPVDESSFVVTSPTRSIAMEEPEPTPWARPALSRSGIQPRARFARPPSIRAPEPASMTRIHARAAAPR